MDTIVIDELETDAYICCLRQLFDQLYVESVCTEIRDTLLNHFFVCDNLDRNIEYYVDTALGSIDEDAILEKWIIMINSSNIPNNILTHYLRDYMSSHWRREHLETNEWKQSIISSVIKMLK